VIELTLGSLLYERGGVTAKRGYSITDRTPVACRVFS
jgi:hypothetical protein